MAAKPSLRQRLFSAPVVVVDDASNGRYHRRKSSFLSRVVTKVVPCVSAPIITPLPLKVISKPDLDTTLDVLITPPPPPLPEDETDGMTSGAVQPPGTQLVHHDPDDSDRTSYTDDDHHEDDEELRLIKSGGSGIPIGLVRT